MKMFYPGVRIDSFIYNLNEAAVPLLLPMEASVTLGCYDILCEKFIGFVVSLIISLRVISLQIKVSGLKCPGVY